MKGKKLLPVTLAAALVLLSFSSCAKGKPPVVNTVNVQPGFVIEDYSTVEKMVPAAEVVVRGTITKIDKTAYISGSETPFTFATVSCNEVFKGNPGDTLDFTACGGYVSYGDYVKQFSEEELKKNNPDMSEAKMKTGVIKYQWDGSNVLETGKEYLLFLLRDKNGTGQLVAFVPNGIMEVKGDTLSPNDKGETLKKADVLAAIGKLTGK